MKQYGSKNEKENEIKSPKKNKKDNECKSIIAISEKKKFKVKKVKDCRSLKRKLPIYDSLDDEENTSDIDLIGNSISPNNIFILIYDIIITFLTIFEYVYLPISLANTHNFCDEVSRISDKMKYLSETIFILDIFISLFRGYYNYEYNIILNNKKIIKHYFGTYFFNDLIGAIPSFFINRYFCYRNENFSYLPKYSMTTKQIFLKNYSK